MIPYESWSTIRKKLSNTNPYYMSDEFLNWIRFKHYPIVNLTQETLSFTKLSQYLNVTSYGKWLPTTITKQFLYPRIYDKILLTSQEPYAYLRYKVEQGWILIDVKQAGKHISRN